MNKLHSLAFYALVTPAITLGAGSVLAQQTTGQEMDREQRSSQREQADQKTYRPGQSDAQKGSDRQAAGDRSRMENLGYMSSLPANGRQATHLIGATVSTATDNNVGPVEDLIIDEQGQVVAIVVAVGGFLGMGEKDVAIGWNHVTVSGTPDEQNLQIDLTRENLRSAPEFEIED